MTVGSLPLHFSFRQLYNFFKYAIYCLLMVNVYLFFSEEWQATGHVFSNGIALSDIIVGFSATIDTANWVILLLMFELETYVIPDYKLQGRLKWGLLALRTLCYALILYALYGYIAKSVQLLAFVPSTVTELCSLPGWSFMTALDEFTLLTPDNCRDFAAAQLFNLPDSPVITSREALLHTQYMASVDVVNALTWVLIVVILEVDVWVQLRHTEDNFWLKLNKLIKFVLYGILLTCAIVWGVDGDFLDFWDAFLWLLAFVFIELNIFEWQKELQVKP